MVLYFVIIECLKLGHVSENMMSTEVSIYMEDGNYCMWSDITRFF